VIPKSGQVNLQLGQHSRDLELLQRIVSWTGKGYICGPYQYSGQCEKYTWSCTKRKDVLFLLELMYPLLGTRRRLKADEAIKKIKDQLA
jgi:hypothetical protein